MKYIFLLLILFFNIVFSNSNLRAEDKYTIVTTTGMITDIVRQVAGSRAEVTGLIGTGIDPHLYKPTRNDIAALMKADVVFYNGLLLEGKMTDALVRVATSGKKVYAVTELLSEDELLAPEEFEGAYDPHVWMDPLAWAKAVKVVRDKLIEFDAANRDYYFENAARYLLKLNQLHDYSLKVLNSIPDSSRVLVTAHDAFNYFSRRYDFQVIGIQGISTESEASVIDIERIVSELVERKIKAVFVESTVSDRNIRALIEGAGARGHSVRIGGQLFSDAMGSSDTYQGTYIGMLDHNVTTIAKSLGGAAPAGGMQGLLKE